MKVSIQHCARVILLLFLRQSVPEPSFVLRSREAAVSALCPVPRGQFLLLGRSDGAVELWCLSSRRRSGPPIQEHELAVLEIACTPKTALTQGRDGRVLCRRIEGPEDALSLGPSEIPSPLSCP